MFRRPRRQGLTLIELLVVVAILAILVALMLPAIMRLRSLAEEQEDREQMRVLGHAWLAYARSHHGRPVQHRTSDPYDAWLKKLTNYGDITDVLVSPGDPLRKERLKFMQTNPTRLTTSFVLNPYFSTTITDSVTGKLLSVERLSDCTALSRAIAILPVSTQASVPGPGYIFPQGWLVPPVTAAWARTTGRFGIQPDRFANPGDQVPGRANYFFADGHVEPVTADRIKAWIDAGQQFLIPQQ
ncbi:MAG TPA: prepilin-type N-terminal cleavage/methylation domain-containing protein [Gemmatales bacterium]|nr:prepilin-type N-terminal cleavage/methylation domain-containing protein [Gemmatales bacterium]